MDKYYYFIAQLPMLFFGREAGISIDYFIGEAKKWLSAKDFRTLSRIELDRMSGQVNGNKVVREVSRFESQVQQDIVNWRKAQIRDQDYKPTAFPVSLLKDGHPLDAETKLLQLKWDYMDQMEREHHFDFGTVVLYYLKLQILQRLFVFNKEKGLLKFRKLYEVTV